MATMRVIGPGRAGRSLVGALVQRGWTHGGDITRTDDAVGAAAGVDLLVIATPDATVADVASVVAPCADTVVIHLSGSLGLDVVAHHPRHGSLHPLATLPDPVVGAARLLDRCTFAVAGDPLVTEIAEVLGGEAVAVPDDRRAAYHATASVAANHVIALAAQVERLAVDCGVPADAFLRLMQDALTNVRRVGPRAAITGPAARGDIETLRRHLDALPDGELDLYAALAAEAAAVAGRPLRITAAGVDTRDEVAA